MKAFFAVVSLSLSACVLSPMSNGAPKPNVSIGGDAYLINQITASTWTATAPGSAKSLAGSAASKAELLDAIEKTSGCKVTDSDYSHQGMQLDAQVECGSRLKN